MSAGNTINAQRQLQSTLRSDPVAIKHVNHLKQLHDAAVKRSDALSKKFSHGMHNNREISSEELVEYRLKDSSEQVARQIARQTHQQMETLMDVQQRVDKAMKESAVLFEEEEYAADADPEDKLKGREWVESSRRKIIGQVFRFNESCDERQEQLEEFCNWFELYENMWPLPLVTNNIQYDELQGAGSVDVMQDQLNEMEKLWPKMGMMREDLTKLMAQAAEMGRRALSAELKAEVQNLTRKLNKSEELAEQLQRSLDAEKNTTRELKNEAAKTKQVQEVQMARKMQEIQGLNDQIAKNQENNRKQIEETRALYAEREDKLKETIKILKETTKAEIDALKAQISDLTQINAALEESVGGLKAEIVEKEQHIERLRETVRTLEGKLQAKQKELEQAQEDLRIEKEEAKKREAKFLKTIEEQKRLIKKREDEIKQQAIIIAEKQAKIEEQQQEINELKMQVKKLEKELEKVQKQLEEAQKKIAELEKRVASLAAACEKLKVELKEKEAEIKELKEAATKYVHQIAELETRVEGLTQDLATTKEELKQRIAEHEHDKVMWAVEKQAFEEHVQQLTDEGEGLRNDLQAKGVELEELAQAKQKMMEDYEQTIAQQTEAFEARISTLESERNELLEYKAYQESRTFEDAETEVDNQWFVENAQVQMSTSTNNRSTAVTPAANSADGNIEGGLFAGEQAQRVLSKFKLLREKLYFMRVGFERDSTEFRSVIKESLEKKAAVQNELDLDVTLLRQKVEHIFEIAHANRVAISDFESDAANNLVLDMCDECICLLEQVSSARQEAPTRLACELVLNMESAETEGNQDDLKKNIAADIARACGGPLEKIKVRSLRESPVIADLIVCQGLDPTGKSTMEVFKLLQGQVANPDSVLMRGQATCKAKDLRLKQAFSQKEPRKSSNLKLLQGIPRTLLEVEQVLEGIEGALADPATLANDPTVYAPDQERPSTAVVAQLRPLLAVARMNMGTEFAEPNYDFSSVSKLHNKWRKSHHQAQEGFLEDGPRLQQQQPQQDSGNQSPVLTRSSPQQQSPPGSPGLKRKSGWKVEMSSPPLSPLPAASSTPLAALKTQGSRRELLGSRPQPPTCTAQAPALPSKNTVKASPWSSATVKKHELTFQMEPTPEETNASFVSWRRATLPQDTRGNGVTFGSSTFSTQREHLLPGSSTFPSQREQSARKAMLSETMHNRQFTETADQAETLVAGLTAKSFGASFEASPMPVPSNARVHLPKTWTVNLPNDPHKMGDLSAAGVKGNNSDAIPLGMGSPSQYVPGTSDGIPLGMESPSQYVPGTSHINKAQPAQADVQSHVRLRTLQTAEMPSQPQRASAHSIVFTSKPVSKPITVSRRISSVEYHQFSEMNRPEEQRLPQLIEVYELQRNGLVGRASFKEKARPASVDEMELERLRQEMHEQAAENDGFKPTGVAPDFSAYNPYRWESQAGFGATHRPQAVKMPSSRQATKLQSLSARSPADVEPWRVPDMEQSFDPSATAPAYRPSKVIRSLDSSSFNNKKRLPATVNPRLNAFVVTMGQDLSTSAMIHDLDIEHLMSTDDQGGVTEGSPNKKMPDSLLQFNDSSEQV